MRRSWLLVFVLGLAVHPLAAQPFPRRDVPPPLQPWIPWALDGAEESLCPLSGGAHVCLWPGRLVLELDSEGGRFTQELAADRPLYAPLPGGERSWPQDVRLDGQSTAVMAVGDDENGAPRLWLPQGSHRVEGRFRWARLPDALPIPPTTALVTLTVSGTPVPFPRRERDGLLLLRAGTGAADADEEQLRLKVFRRLADDIPLWLETRVAFEVSGKARELRLGGVVIPGSVPVSVSGDLPARVDQGELRVQVRPGSFAVHVLLRLDGKPAELRAGPAAAAPWPEQEIWVFQGNERLRQAEVQGATAIDPSRTDLPEAWRRFPAYLVERDTVLSLREARRGEPEPAPDQISLQRELWLDLDGRGFTARDSFSGTLSHAARLNAAAPAALGRVAVQGQDQLVTADPKTRLPGVELRQRQLQMTADLRVPRAGALPAVGWETNVQRLGLTLNLPPGWRLFAVSGADRAPGAWISRWTLFGFFFVLVVTAAVWKLEGPRWGVVALFTLALCAHESGGPRLVWLSLLAASALLGAVPPGRLRTAARVWLFTSTLALVLIALPFFARQLRGGLFPAAAEPIGPSFFARSKVMEETALMQDAAAPAQPQRAAAPSAPPPAELESRLNVLPSKKAIVQRAYEQDPHAVIQTGAGVPAWSWHREPLEWSGPVAREQRLRLFLLPPLVNLLLAFLRVGLVTLLAWALLRRERDQLLLPRAPLAAAAVLPLLALVPPAAAQETQGSAPQQAVPEEPAPSGPTAPAERLLKELRDRLTRRPPCSPDCLSTPVLDVTVKGGELRIEAEVHAGEAAAWPVPGPAGTWTPRSVTVDSAPAALARLADGFLHARIAPGVHRVEITGPLPPADSFTLQLPDPPRLVRGHVEGWQLDGIRDDGGTDGSLQLTRTLKRTGTAEAAEGVYEPWFEVRRELSIGVSWNVETVVRRVTPTGAPAVLRIPLLKGMLTTGDREVKDGEVLVTMGRDQAEARWSSVVTPMEGGPFELKAPADRPWSEVWVIDCGPSWQCAAEGLPPVSRLDGERLLTEYRPWPGERLALTFAKPAGVPGQSLTVDTVTLEARPGLRLTDTTFDAAVRASRAGSLSLTLPAGADAQALSVNGQPKPIRPDGGTLSVPVDAGESKVQVSWRQKWGVSLLTRAPRVTLGQPAANVTVVLRPPDGRWLLVTSGPRWGPSVLFWSELLVLLLAAALLARVPGSPLRAWQWLLLALGIAQLPLAVAVLVAGWFFAIAWRQRRPFEHPGAFNLAQALLVVWTLVFLGCLYAAVWQGLIARPDMEVSGNGSNASELRWYVDRAQGQTPAAAFFSLPLWVYRVGMLAFSLWLAASLVRWLPWAFRAFTDGGGWRGRHAGPPAPPAPPVPATAPPPLRAPPPDGAGGNPEGVAP